MPKNEQTTFVLESIVEKPKFYVLRNNGDGYFVWDPDIKKKIRAGEIQEGDKIKVDYTPGEWPRVNKIYVMEKGTGPLPQEEGAAPGKPSEIQDHKNAEYAHIQELKEMKIMRSVALKAAVEIYGPMSEEVSSEDITVFVENLADKFLAWLSKDGV